MVVIGKDRLPRVNQRERVAGSFAKKAAAFFRISRSSRSCRFSFRSCASSSRSAVVSPVRPLVRLARARCTHCPEGRFRQIEIAGDRADALAFVEHQPDRLRLEVVIEPATRASLFWSSLPWSWTSYPPFGKCPRNRITRTRHWLRGKPHRCVGYTTPVMSPEDPRTRLP